MGEQVGLQTESRTLSAGAGGIWDGKEDGEGTDHHGRSEQGVAEGREDKKGGKFFRNSFPREI